MFTLEEYQKLQAAAFILHDKGLLQISPPSLVCYLMILKSGKTCFKLQSPAEQLNWSVERTRKSLRELANKEWEGLTLIEAVKKNRSQGRFAPTYYQLVFRPTPEFTPTFAPTDQSTLAKQNYPPPAVIPPAPNKISPSRSEPSRLNNCCLNKNNRKQTTEGVYGGDSETKRHATHQLVNNLKNVGVSDKAIAEIQAKYPPEIIQTQLNYLPYRQAKNPAGLLVQAIKGDWSAPKEYLAVREQQKQAQQQKQDWEAQKQKMADEAKQQKEMRQKLSAIEKQLSLPERQALQHEAERKVRQRLGKSWPFDKPLPQTFLRSEFSSLLIERYRNKNLPS